MKVSSQTPAADFTDHLLFSGCKLVAKGQVNLARESKLIVFADPVFRLFFFVYVVK